MKLKTKLLMILLPIVLTLTLSAQTSNTNKTNSENELGIDLNKSYSGQEVQTIIDIILEESDKSIDTAYKEGYKQATIELQPEVEYWKSICKSQKANSLNKTFKSSAISFGTGFIIGCVCGFYIGTQFQSN